MLIYAPHGLAEGISALAAEPIFAAILGTAGPPRFRRRRNGFGTLLHIILEQQVSIDAAAKMYHRLVGLCRPLAPATFLALDDATLRSCGFSRQKMGYARDLAAAVERGSFDFARLAAAEDETALADLLAIRGIGRWSAEIYLLFALGRPDIWPAADLGLQLAMAEQLGLGSRPGEAELRRPRRSVATLAVGRGLPFLAVLSACPRTRRTAPAAGALCLIAQQIAGSRACPVLAQQQPARHDHRGDDEERRHAALRQNANQDLDQDGEQECEYWAQQNSACDRPPSPVRNTVHFCRRLLSTCTRSLCRR